MRCSRCRKLYHCEDHKRDCKEFEKMPILSERQWVELNETKEDN